MSNLAQQEADVAIRFMPAGKSPDLDLTGSKIATAWMAAYGSGDCWIGQRGMSLSPTWAERSPFPDLPVRGEMLDGEVLISACAAEMGLAMLPCFLAEPRLPRLTEPFPGLDIWVLVHPDLRRNPRLRVFRTAIVEALKRHRPQLEGRTEPS